MEHAAKLFEWAAITMGSLSAIAVVTKTIRDAWKSRTCAGETIMFVMALAAFGLSKLFGGP